ncbi:B12-binding domain-containing radical SAM protein [bacterium]|nr:B12-binding domain-containing radical SAM protein [bacterium]
MNTADITILNLNLLYVRYVDFVDKELHVPLGSLYLTKALENAGFKVDFRDYQLNSFDEPFDIDNIVAYLADCAPIVGFSCMANLLPFTILAMKTFKELFPEKFLILGGVGSKSVEEKILKKFPWVNCIAVGEGEKTGPELTAAIKSGTDLRNIPGLFFRDSDGTIVQTPARGRIKDLNDIPLPAFHKVDLRRYKGYGMMTSRGCPYPCTFCSVAPIWGHQSTFRSNENIIAEMKVLHEQAGVKLFLFQDEFFVSSKQKVLSFCDELEKSGLRVFWKAFGRVDLTDREMMEAMAKTGCVELRFGIESGSDRILSLTKKGFSAEDAIKKVSEAIEIFRRVDAFYMWGFPFESMNDFNQTVFQMVSLRMMGARILPSLLCILPQTDLYMENLGKYPLDFCPELFPEYMITGHETSSLSKVSISPRHQPIYDFIQGNPEIFPGFFHMDLERNVLPKLAVLKRFGFYPSDEKAEPTTESCGAHSPKTTAAPGLATRTIDEAKGLSYQ